MKNILASLSGFGSDRAVLDTAIALAKWHDSHVLCLHTRIDTERTVAVSELAGPRHDLSQDLLRGIAAEEDVRSRQAMAAQRILERLHGMA
jgi:hypothetical protein